MADRASHGALIAILSPLGGTVAAVIFQYATAPLRGGSWGNFAWRDNLMSTLLWALVLTPTLGLAIHRLLKRSRYTGLLSYSSAGLCSGLLLVASTIALDLWLVRVVPDFAAQVEPSLHDPMVIAVSVGRTALAGAFTGALAWLLLQRAEKIRQREDAETFT